MNKRALVEYLLRKHELILTRAVSSHERFAVLKNLERAEKRFLLAFVVALSGGVYWLAMELWGLNVSDLVTLPIHRVISLIFGTALVATSALAILGYLSIGLVIQRAVVIRPRGQATDHEL
jgi:hypothetical protein